MPVTEIDIRRQVRRLEVVFSTKKTTDEIVEAWKWVLADDLDADELMKAVSDYAKSGGRYFPTPGQIREIALVGRVAGIYGQKAGPKAWDQTLDGPCPICGAVLRMLKPEEQVQFGWDEKDGKFMHMGADSECSRFGVLHDRRKHEQANQPAVGYWR